MVAELPGDEDAIRKVDGDFETIRRGGDAAAVVAKRSGSRGEPERAALRLRSERRLALGLRLRLAPATTLVVLTLRIVQNGDGEDQQPEGCEAGITGCSTSLPRA